MRPLPPESVDSTPTQLDSVTTRLNLISSLDPSAGLTLAMPVFRVLLLLCLLLGCVSSAPTLSYTVYEDYGCSNQILSGTQPATWKSADGASGYLTDCFFVGNNVFGAPNAWAQAACLTEAASSNGYSGIITLYDDARCLQQGDIITVLADQPTGACSPQTLGSPGSAVVKCNGALRIAVGAVPLLAVIIVAAFILL